MNLINSKDVVADRIRNIQTLAATASSRPRNARQPRSAWRRLAARAGVRVRTARTA